MDTAPLFKWLGLPPGPWPPDDRALLGLPPTGPVDEATAEQNALARMELLRPHQLVNPELVTEGMNRLAQALIAITSIPTAPPPPVIPARKPAPSVPQVLEAEVIEISAVPAVPVAPTRPASVPLPPPILIHEPELEPVLLAEEPPPPGVLLNRRKAYRELAFLRRLRRLWDRIGPVAGSPSDPVRTAEAVYVTRTAGKELRTLLGSFPAASTIVGRDGRLVTAVFTQPHATIVLRELIPAQRTALAADWAAGRAMLETGYVALRSSLRNSVPRNRLRSAHVVVGELFRTNPEWVLVALTLVLILTGVIRFVFRPQPVT